MKLNSNFGYETKIISYMDLPCPVIWTNHIQYDVIYKDQIINLYLISGNYYLERDVHNLYWEEEDPYGTEYYFSIDWWLDYFYVHEQNLHKFNRRNRNKVLFKQKEY